MKPWFLVMPCIVYLTPGHTKDTCQDARAEEECSYFKKEGLCSTSFEIEAVQCPQTCGVCNNVKLAAAETLLLASLPCTDTMSLQTCRIAKQRGLCESKNYIHEEYCRKTCGTTYCSKSKALKEMCEDADVALCSSMKNYCDNTDIRETCPKTCSNCNHLSASNLQNETDESDITEPPPTFIPPKQPRSREEHEDCRRFAEDCQFVESYRLACPITCGGLSKVGSSTDSPEPDYPILESEDPIWDNPNPTTAPQNINTESIFEPQTTSLEQGDNVRCQWYPESCHIRSYRELCPKTCDKTAFHVSSSGRQELSLSQHVPDPEQCYERDTVYPGGVIKTEMNVESTDSCQSLCEEYPDCVLFTFIEKNGNCVLRNQYHLVKESRSRLARFGDVISVDMACLMSSF